ncbi:MAG: HlyD family efflux transporter periplasmic adaptor subunit [bacterium]|nr:HlyD family efflux transporter periplasmic adaptor subunit [bacterium]
MHKRIFAFILFILVLLALLVYSTNREVPFKVSGYIEADQIDVGSRVGGRVAFVGAVEGRRVGPGQVLVELDPFDLPGRRAQAAAQAQALLAAYEKMKNGFRSEEIAQARAARDGLAARLKELIAGPRPQEIAQAQAQLAQAQSQLVLARAEYGRAEKLFQTKVISHDQMDQATNELGVAQATVNARQEALGLLLAGTRQEEIDQARAALAQAEAALELEERGNRAEDIEQARAAWKSAEEAVRVIDRQLAELVVVAPTTSTVEAVDLQPGDMIAPNAPILSLIETDHLWVRAYVPESHLDMKLGQRLWVTTDSFPGERFAGHITFVARQGEFTPRNIQTPEERSKQVFRIKVTLDEGLDRLRPGMAADVLLE